ncbi:MAG: hypothetical protein K8R69_03695 [Deltaproteobacteria bacterium]|nr:hypothetical protein [Deltaproteobacteria bacterium]
MAPLRLSLEASYLAVGNAGFPGRAGFLLTYRPNSFMGVGLHTDTNFTDHVSGTLRFEGIWPIHRLFHLEGALELGARGMINQSQSIQGMLQPLTGAGFTVGGEIAASIPFSDLFGLSVFARGFYSPGGGFGLPQTDGSPNRGVNWSGGEFMFGLRVDFYPPVAPRRPVAADEASAPRRSEAAAPVAAAPAPREALQTFQATVDRLLLENPAVPPPSSVGDAGSHADAAPVTTSDAAADAAPVAADGSATAGTETREEILGLQREILALSSSVSSLETEIQGATQLLNDLDIGHETGEAFHIRLDGLYDAVTARPSRVDPAAINAFAREFATILRDSDPLRLLIQSSTESFGPAILRNLRSYEEALQQYQRTLPVRSSSGGLARGDLDEPLAQFRAVTLQVDQLRQHPETTAPSASQVSLWRARLGRIREHLNVLDNRLDDATYETLNGEFTRLQSGFDSLLTSMEEAQRSLMTSRALFSHYQGLRAARRPAQAEAALRGMTAELTGAPESFRRLRERNLNSLRIALESFLGQHPTQAAWATSRDLAVSVLRWIDPSYMPPAPPETHARRRGAARGTVASGSTPGTPTFRFPNAGGATGRRDE